MIAVDDATLTLGPSPACRVWGLSRASYRSIHVSAVFRLMAYCRASSARPNRPRW